MCLPGLATAHRYAGGARSRSRRHIDDEPVTSQHMVRWEVTGSSKIWLTVRSRPLCKLALPLGGGGRSGLLNWTAVQFIDGPLEVLENQSTLDLHRRGQIAVGLGEVRGEHLDLAD